MRNIAVCLVLFSGACAHLPELAPIPEASRSAAVARCRQAFPRQPWRATHAIIATLPFGYNGAVVGVTAAGAEGLHAILLSPEGISLYDGVQKIDAHGRASLKIRRAVAPFDRFDFAASLMADVGNAFLPPSGEPSSVGSYPSGATVCRFTPAGGETTDVELAATGPVRILTFRNLSLTRQIDLLGAASDGFYPHIHLVVPGSGGYALDMTLVDHE